MTLRPIFLLAAALLAATSLIAQEQTIEDQLRQALREVTIQQRQLQTDIGVARAELEAALEDNEDLRKRLEKLASESAAEQKAMQENINNLNTQLEKESAEVARLADLLVKWKDAYVKMRTVARAEAARKENLSVNVVDMANEIAELKSENRELFRIAMEILERYESFGLGKALTAREPFTGVTRTHLQNLVQDYQDELLEHRIAMDPPGEEASGEDPEAKATDATSPTPSPDSGEEAEDTRPEEPPPSSDKPSDQSAQSKKIFLR